MNKSRPIRFTIRMSQEEKEVLEKKVEAAGMNKQTYFLDCILGKEIVNYEYLNKIYSELQRQGTNLNQLVKLAHQTNSVESSELLETLKEMKTIWQSLKQSLPKPVLEEQSTTSGEKKKPEVI